MGSIHFFLDRSTGLDCAWAPRARILINVFRKGKACLRSLAAPVSEGPEGYCGCRITGAMAGRERDLRGMLLDGES